MKKKVVLIFGESRSGKTTLARRLAPPASCIHLDQVCILAALRYPQMLPPEIEDLYGANLLIDLSGKIQIFTAHLTALGRLRVLIDECISLIKVRGHETIRVIEGNSLNVIRDQLAQFLQECGISIIEVFPLSDGFRIDGRDFLYEDGVQKLLRDLYPQAVKYF